MIFDRGSSAHLRRGATGDVFVGRETSYNNYKPRLRQIFDADQDMKENLTGGRLMLVCAETGKELHSGVAYAQDDLERAKPAKLLQRCRHCGKLHIFKFTDARLKPARH